MNILEYVAMAFGFPILPVKEIFSGEVVGSFRLGLSIFGQQYQVYTQAPITEVVQEWYTGFLKGGCITRNPTLFEIEQFQN